MRGPIGRRLKASADKVTSTRKHTGAESELKGLAEAGKKDQKVQVGHRNLVNSQFNPTPNTTKYLSRKVPLVAPIRSTVYRLPQGTF